MAELSVTDEDRIKDLEKQLFAEKKGSLLENATKANKKLSGELTTEKSESKKKAISTNLRKKFIDRQSCFTWFRRAN